MIWQQLYNLLHCKKDVVFIMGTTKSIGDLERYKLHVHVEVLSSLGWRHTIIEAVVRRHGEPLCAIDHQ